MITLPVKWMAKQQCMRCIDVNSVCETDGQTTMYAQRCIDANSACETDGQTTMYALY